MSERTEFMRKICEEPGEDTHRLVFADWIEEHDEPERAEFIRVQVELETYRQREREHNEMRKTHPWALPYGGKCDCSRLLRKDVPCRFCRLQIREEELLDTRNPAADNEHIGDVWFSSPQMGMVTHGSQGPNWLYPKVPTTGVTWTLGTWECKITRGFISEITADGDSWMAHADKVYWHPNRKVRCQGPSPEHAYYRRPVHDTNCRWGCTGTGFIYLPMPPAAQPIERVTLTHYPEVLVFDRGMRLFHFSGGVNHQLTDLFDRSYTERDVAERLLKLEWPHIEFKIADTNRRYI